MATATRGKLIPDQLSGAALRSLEVCLSERSLRNYVEIAWPRIEPQTFVPGKHIDAVCEHLEAVSRNEIQNLIINIPPKHAKSLQVSVLWPTWEWGPLNRPETRWLTMSYAASLSLRDALRSRQLIQSGWYQAAWGHCFQLADDQNAKSRYNTTANGYRVSSSVGGIGTGEGGERLVIDDPHNLRDVNSPVALKSVIDWWDRVMPTRLNNPKASATVIIMQRSRHDDLTGHIRETMGKRFEYLVLPGEYEAVSKCRTRIFTDWRNKEGQLLWPAQFGKKEMADLKLKLGSHDYAAQIQQRPTPQEGGIIKRSWWRYYSARPDAFDLVCQSWDMAFKELKTSSYVVGLVWGVKGSNKYLLDRVREHLGFTDTIKAVKNLSEKWPQASHKFIEDKANGPAVIDAAKKEISGLIACTPEGPKESRAFAISPEIEAGNVHLPHPSIAPWIEEYVEQMSQFPMGPNDDDMDATSQALLEIKKRIQHLTVNLPDIVSLTRRNPMGTMTTRR